MFATLLLAFLFFYRSLAQDQSPRPTTNQQPAQSDTGLLTFHITTREVVLDVIALDPEDHPILDLAPSDLQISEHAGHSPDKPASGHHVRRERTLPSEVEPIASLHVVDPIAPQTSSEGAATGFRIGATCLDRSTLHYQVSFHPGPDALTSGYHQVVLTTSRRGVRLHYPHRYYIGVLTPPAKPPVIRPSAIDKLLRQASCYYPETPPSISLRARLINADPTGILRYSVAVDASSLSFLTLTSEKAERQPIGLDRRVQLDYAACIFDLAGHPIDFFHVPLDQVLTSASYARALALGFPHVLEFPAPKYIALTRFIVRDRATGNLGATDVQFPFPDLPSRLPPDISEITHSLSAETTTNLSLYNQFSRGVWFPPPHGPIGSFGSITPAPQSFCGDVFELERQSDRLPDFRELDPIGSLYTSTLDVPSQFFTNTSGIPGVTPRTNLFGIDYHGVFWIQRPGKYQFRMISDDGALLFIDDAQVIDLDGLHSARGGSGEIYLGPGRHTIHVPYYQGAVTSVALLLWVKPQGQSDWQIFNIPDFPPPPANSRP